MSYNLPHTNADIRSASKMICNEYAAHALQSMRTSAKLLVASIAACINGIIPSAFKYTAMSVCLSIIEDDLQHNRVPPAPTKRRSHSTTLNDVILTFDEEKME
jgi:hypothetical protein